MRIAVVGAGISGLGAAHLLSRAHEVEVFERAERAGGHTNTVHHDGLALDTGFLVLNGPNYPLLGRLLRELGVATQPSEMSFSVSCGDCGLEWSGKRPFAQRRNLASPRFASLLWEVGRWLRTAERSLDRRGHETDTLERYVDEHGYSRRFRTHFLVPLTSALWSTAPERALDFPAAYAIRFFANHGMLGFGRFGWQTVRGGSSTYVDRIAERLGPRLHVGLGGRALRRTPVGVELTTDDGETRTFDRAVVALHADRALRLLVDPSPEEQRALGAFRYTANETVLHTDTRFLPRVAGARASWNYQVNGSTRPTMTYWLNRLQQLDTETDYCVTLNRTEQIDPARVVASFVYEHPLFTLESLAAQRELAGLGHDRHTFYVGAHHGNGFHEDGLASGVRAAAALGVDW